MIIPNIWEKKCSKPPTRNGEIHTLFQFSQVQISANTPKTLQTLGGWKSHQHVQGFLVCMYPWPNSAISGISLRTQLRRSLIICWWQNGSSELQMPKNWTAQTWWSVRQWRVLSREIQHAHPSNRLNWQSWGFLLLPRFSGCSMAKSRFFHILSIVLSIA